MQCSIRNIADMWKREGVQCVNPATTIFRHEERIVSYRCDEHARDRFLDSQYKPEPVPA